MTDDVHCTYIDQLLLLALGAHGLQDNSKVNQFDSEQFRVSTEEAS